MLKNIVYISLVILFIVGLLSKQLLGFDASWEQVGEKIFAYFNIYIEFSPENDEWLAEEMQRRKKWNLIDLLGNK